MIILHDGDGHYLVTEPSLKRGGKVFYGDGKKFFGQKTYQAGGNTSTNTWSRNVWSPTSPHGATIRQNKNKWSISCAPKKKTPLTPLSEAERTKILDKAKFYPRVWHRGVQLLARDEEANYYIVDSAPTARRSKTPFNFTDVNAYFGPAGRMKKLKIKEIASDAEGFVVVTRIGTFLVDRDKKANLTAKFKLPKKRGKDTERRELRVLDAYHNRHLIFSTLGVYTDRLWTPCDDLYIDDDDLDPRPRP